MKCFLIFQFFAILSCKQFLVKTKDPLKKNETLAKTKEAKEYGKVDHKNQIKGSFQGRIIVPAIVTWVAGNRHLLLLLDPLAGFAQRLPPQQQPLQLLLVPPPPHLLLLQYHFFSSLAGK